MAARDNAEHLDPQAAFREERERIRSQMGGEQRVAALRAVGRRTARDRIDRLLDAGSFQEVGTFARSVREEDAATTPGDGKVAGHGLVDGRPVTVVADDITVKRASSSLTGSRKLVRLFEQACARGNPYLYLGETGGARIPDSLGSTMFSQLPPFPGLVSRLRRIPMATAIVGDSFGGSSFIAALSDFVVQVRGSCLAVTSPRVIEMATGEALESEVLGGVDVGAELTGQVDLAVETEDEAFDALRRFLGYLPSDASSPPPSRETAQGLERDPALETLVPSSPRRAYDMRKLVTRIVDDGELLELKPRFARNILTGLARVGGAPVGIVASQPAFAAGTLTPDACDKATRLLTLCDAFGLPLLFLQDTPGFMVGRAVEHDRILGKAMMYAQALVGASVPKVGLVVRKAFGLAFFSMGGPQMGMDFLAAWPGAQIGFMDPLVGANVIAAGRERAEIERLADEMAAETDPRGPAGIMALDEIIDPAETRAVLAQQIGSLVAGGRHRPRERRLATWPTCW